MKPEEKNKTDLPTQLKVANRSGLEAETLSRGLRLAAGGAKRPPQGGQGCSPGAPLVTFPATGKSPGVEGRSALLVGAGAKSDGLLRRPLPPLWGAEGRQPLARFEAGALGSVPI